MPRGFLVSHETLGQGRSYNHTRRACRETEVTEMPKTIYFRTGLSTFKRGAQLGQGGAGKVFAVTDEHGDQFALKLLGADKTTSQTRKRFSNEIRFCRNPPHKNIIEVLDHGPYIFGQKETLFYVMPLFDKTFRKLIEEGRDPAEMLNVLLDAMKGLSAAHKKSVWHRDVKPENILASSDLSQVVVADWGIAHFTEEELHTFVETKPGQRLANFEYAAPEQGPRGKKVDHRADIYALGLVMTEIFTGEVPRGANPTKIGEVREDFAFLDEVAEGMRNQNPDSRPGSIEYILGEIAVRRELAASSGRIAALQATKLESDQPYDPLLAEPVELVRGGADYRDGTLFLKLSQPVTPQWKTAFGQQPIQSSMVDRRGQRKDPQSFTFNGDVMRIEIDEGNINQLMPYVHRYLHDGNNHYRKDMQEEQRRREQAQKSEIKRRIEEDRRRQSAIRAANRLI